MTKPAANVPTSYERRILKKTIAGQHWPLASAAGGGWKTEWFGTDLQPKTLKEAQDLIDGWNDTCITSGMLVEYRLGSKDLRCSDCDVKCTETYAGNTCLNCHLKDKAMKKNKNDWMADIDMSKKPPLFFPKAVAFTPTATSKFLPTKPVTLTRAEGDIWEIPASSSPLWTKQWGYKGTAKEPYIISYRTSPNGGTTSDGWACSCPGFTKHTPRNDCKHVVNVKHMAGIKVAPVKQEVANLDSEEAAAFAEFKRQQAAAKKQKPGAGDSDLSLFGATGRKFR